MVSATGKRTLSVANSHLCCKHVRTALAFAKRQLCENRAISLGVSSAGLRNPAQVLGGCIGGKSRSAAKVAAARVNGRLGGHPKGLKTSGVEVTLLHQSARLALI